MYQNVKYVKVGSLLFWNKSLFEAQKKLLSGDTVDGSEIPKKGPVNNGIKYQPQLVFSPDS